jgi:GT2 family glycosyltransferase
MVDALAHLRNPWLGTPVTALPRDAIPVDFVSGCAMLIRTRLLREIGSLDTAYVYSVEDVDLCTRARRAGRTVLFVPSCVVVHAHAASVGGWDGPFAVRHALWGRAYYAGKFGNLPTRWASWSFLAAVILPVKVARRTGRTSRLRLLCDGLATIKRGARRRPLPAPRGPEDTRT